MKGCRPLEDDEIAMILTGFNGTMAARDRALFVLGLRTGLRISELLSLRVQDVFRHDKLLDRVQVARRHCKGRTEGKVLPIHPEAKGALRAWLTFYTMLTPDLAGTMPLFPSRLGSPKALSRVGGWRVLKRLFHQAGLEGPGLGCHALRKSFAARMFKAFNGDLLKTQAALGHRSVASTASYIGVSTAEVEAAILAA
jgi:integrase